MPEENVQIIEKRMPLPERNREEQHEDFTLFCDHFNLIKQNAKIIIADEKLFYCSFHLAMIGNYIMGVRYLPVGLLLLLWEDEMMVDSCQECCNKIYIIGAGGSPLSGTNRYWGYCPYCEKEVKGSYKPFHALWRPAIKMLSGYRNITVLECRKTQHFSWRYGLVGEETPDKIIKEAVKGVTLQELICTLNQ